MTIRGLFRHKTDSANARTARGDARRVRSYYTGATKHLSPDDARLPGRLKLQQNLGLEKRKHLAYVLVLVLIVAISLLGSSTTSSVRITDPSLLVRQQKDYQRAIDDWLKSSPWRRIKLFVNENSLKEHVKLEFPEVADLDLGVPLLGRSPRVNLRLDEVVMVFVDKNGAVYGVSEEGIAINGSKLTSKLAGLPVMGDDLISGIEQGQEILSRSVVDFIVILNKTLVAAGINVDSYSRSTEGFDVIVKIKGESYQGKTYIYEGAGEQGARLAAAVKHVRQNNIQPSSYIDVRVDERAYIK